VSCRVNGRIVSCQWSCRVASRRVVGVLSACRSIFRSIVNRCRAGHGSCRVVSTVVSCRVASFCVVSCRGLVVCRSISRFIVDRSCRVSHGPCRVVSTVVSCRVCCVGQSLVWVNRLCGSLESWCSTVVSLPGVVCCADIANCVVSRAVSLTFVRFVVSYRHHRIVVIIRPIVLLSLAVERVAVASPIYS
jgi:hypothetical protein